MPFFTSEGCDIFYREQGSGELLFILPGNTASSACHEGELQYFSEKYRAVSPDFRGTGQSGRMEVWPDSWFGDAARDAAALAAHLGYESFHVMGTSGGAIIALLAAILFPDKVKSVIADSTVELFPPPVLGDEVKQRSARTPEQVEFWRYAHGDDWQQVVDADSGLLLRIEKDGGDVFKGRLGGITCPVLFTASLDDEFLPQVGEQVVSMARQVENSRVYFSRRGSHPLMWSMAAEFRAEVDSFLNRQI